MQPRLLFLLATAMTFSILATAQSWNLNGNTDASLSHKIGTNNAISLRFVTSNVERMKIMSTGNIGVGTSSPAASAILDLSSTTKGLLIPRMTAAQRNSITSPATGLLLYQTDGSSGFYYYSGGWKLLEAGSGGANTALSNLSTTAINQQFLPATTNLYDLGAAAKGWKDIFLNGDVYLDGAKFVSNKGSDNTFVGTLSGGALTSGSGNSALGQKALTSVTSGGANTASGAYALSTNTTGSRNAAYGLKTLFYNTTGNNNTALGYYAMINNIAGSSNTAVGYYSLAYNTASYNTAAGAEALFSNTTGSYNTASGYSALRSNTTGFNNTALGYQALLSNTTADNTTAIGNGALKNNTTGLTNVAIGSYSLFNNTTGEQNVAGGAYSLYKNTTGILNAAFGHGALYNNESGHYNTAIGYCPLFKNIYGIGNVASGRYALYNNTVGSINTAFGSYSLFENITGDGNTAIGNESLHKLVDGSYNTAVGTNASWGTEAATNSTALGALTNISGTNSTAIGYGATSTASNQVRIGNTAVTSIGGQVGWTIFSDGRYKQDVKEEVPGLSFINALRPVTYHLDVESIDKKMMAGRAMPSDSSRGSIARIAASVEGITAKKEKAKVVYTGFIAQEVEKAAEKVNYDFSGVDKPKGAEDFYGLRYSDFVVPLVKAVQQLDLIQQAKDEKIVELQQEVNNLNDRLSKLEMMLKTSNNGSFDLQTNSSNAYLLQNNPNPSKGTTTIRYYVPTNMGSSKLLIIDMKGAIIKTFSLNKGNGQVILNTNTLSAGVYTYTLWVNGQQVDNKQLLVVK